MIDRGCFGLPSVYNPKSDTCASCPAREGCRQRAFSIAQAVRKVVDVEHLLNQLTTDYAGEAPLTDAQVARIAAAPLAIQGRLRSLLDKGFDKAARERLRAGDNPFPEPGAKHMRLAGELLIAGGFTRQKLRESFEKRFDWTRNTAAVETSKTIALLRGLALIEEDDGLMTLPKD